MNDTIVTVQGWLGTDPVLRQAGTTPVANFRVACTPRRLQRSTGAWVDGHTQWYGVSAWRQLAHHCARSLKVGDPVLLTGRLNQRTYPNKDGVEVTAMEIDLITIGHDLSRGISLFQKAFNPRSEAERDAEREEQRDPWQEASAGGTDTIAPSPAQEPDDEEEPAEAAAGATAA